MRPDRRRRKGTGSPRWMVTYSDMVTLILVFFILLFSISQIDLVKFEAVSESFRNRMIFDSFPSPVPMDNPTEQSSRKKSGENLNEFARPSDLLIRNERDENDEDALENLMEDIEDFLNEQDLNNVITANRTERGVVLVLQEKVLFNSGEAVILPSAHPFLEKMSRLLLTIPNKIKVEGHTDSRPMDSYRYPSNWELSGARASSVIRYFIQEYHIHESRLSIVGYSDTRPLVPNDSEENMLRNRRVEIVILNEGQDEDSF